MNKYRSDTPILNFFLAFMLVTVMVGYDIAHTPTPIVHAQNNEVVATASPKASETITEAHKCQYTTPYDTEIERIWGDESCNAKAVLKWKDLKGNTYGENGRYLVSNIDVVQRNGSVDRGLFRINSDTFNDYMKRMPNLLAKYGITKWSDMEILEKNTRMGEIIHRYQGWCAWFAAPNDMCSNNYPNVKREIL